MVSFPRCDNVSLLATSPEKKNPLHRLYAQGHDYHISVNTIMIFIPNSRGAPHTYFAPVRGPLIFTPISQEKHARQREIKALARLTDSSSQGDSDWTLGSLALQPLHSSCPYSLLLLTSTLHGSVHFGDVL